MDTLNYLKSIHEGQLHFADGSKQNIPHWGDLFWAHLFLVRHAEKDRDELHDPGLSAEGEARAERLGRITAETSLDAVYATPTQRARLTAEPVQRRGNTPEVIEYEPNDQTEWMETLLPELIGRQILIVGHQYTIPHLLNQLVGKGFEYDNIPNADFGKFYVVATQGFGKTEVLELRY